LQGIRLLVFKKPHEVKLIDEIQFVIADLLSRGECLVHGCFGCTVNFKNPKEVILIVPEVSHLDIKAVIALRFQRCNHQIPVQYGWKD